MIEIQLIEKKVDNVPLLDVYVPLVVPVTINSSKRKIVTCKKRIVPNQVIDFLNNNINRYTKYDYGKSMEIYDVYKTIIEHIKYYDLYENEYIICNKPLAELFNLDIGDSILFINFNARLCKLFNTNNTNTNVE